MAGVSKIEQMLLKPEVIYQIAKSIESGSCEIKMENGKIVIVRIERTVKYRN